MIIITIIIVVIIMIHDDDYHPPEDGQPEEGVGVEVARAHHDHVHLRCASVFERSNLPIIIRIPRSLLSLNVTCDWNSLFSKFKLKQDMCWN